MPKIQKNLDSSKVDKGGGEEEFKKLLNKCAAPCLGGDLSTRT